MELNDKVKIKGTELKGVIIKVEERRIPNRTTKVLFYTVKHEDGSEQEYDVAELRTI